MMSWLVAPRWTCPAACSPTARRSPATIAITGVARSPVAAATAGRSKASMWQAATIASADAAGISPSSARARARAASTSSIAASQARPSVCAATGPRA
jgi:hypothetical protein